MLLWTTDLHLDCVSNEALDNFLKKISEYNADKVSGLIITGDISIGKRLAEHLYIISKGFSKPIYFILGNHDQYDSSFSKIEKLVGNTVKKIDNVHWLEQSPVILNNIAIVGTCGWYDAYYGNTQSKVYLQDWERIIDFLPGFNNRDILIEMIRGRASKFADNLGKQLKSVCKNDSVDTVIIATHVPPYDRSSYFDGEMSGRDWLPWYTSRSTGAEIDRYSEHNPGKKFVVLAGHCHGRSFYQRSSNLVIYSGFAEYYHPKLAGHIEIDKEVGVTLY